jgi:hypothetical protein
MNTSRTSSSSSDPRYDLEAYEQYRERASQSSRSRGSSIASRSDTDLNLRQSLPRARLAIPAEDDSRSSVSSLDVQSFYDLGAYLSLAQSPSIGRQAAPSVTYGRELPADRGGRPQNQIAPWSPPDRAVAPRFDNASSAMQRLGGDFHQRPNRSSGTSFAAQPNTSDGSSSSRLRATRGQYAASSRRPAPMEGLRDSSSPGDISSSSSSARLGRGIVEEPRSFSGGQYHPREISIKYSSNRAIGKSSSYAAPSAKSGSKACASTSSSFKNSTASGVGLGRYDSRTDVDKRIKQNKYATLYPM